MTKAALKGLGLKGREVSLLFADNERIRGLNKEFRGKDKPTDVLSFPMQDDVVLGDIAISVDKTKAQAEEFGVAFEDELARLIIHGLLHLIGYDHVKGGAQARMMKAKEEELMEFLMDEGLI